MRAGGRGARDAAAASSSTALLPLFWLFSLGFGVRNMYLCRRVGLPASFVVHQVLTLCG